MPTFCSNVLQYSPNARCQYQTVNDVSVEAQTANCVVDFSSDHKYPRRLDPTCPYPYLSSVIYKDRGDRWRRQILFIFSVYLRVVNLERGRRQCVDCASQKEDVDSSLFICLPQEYFRFELAIVSQDDIIVLGCHLLPKSCAMLCSPPQLMDFLPSILYGIQANGVQDVGSKHRNTPSQKGVFFEQLNQM